MKVEIPLTFSRTHFEEIYFLNGRGHFFKDPILKPIIRNFLYSVLATVFSVLIPLYAFDPTSKDNNLGILILFGAGFCIGQLAALIFGILYYAKWREIKTWRRDINHFLDAREKVQYHSLILTDEYFSLREDEREKMEKWSNFGKVELDPEYITLMSNELYLIPAKSMTKEQFDRLSLLVTERVRMSHASA